MSWDAAQTWESDWWGTCQNTLGEEMKQLTYARRMGLKMYHDGRSPYNIDMKGRSVLDIGGGPASLLLKCANLGSAIVADPLTMPDWCADRYKAAGIWHLPMAGEEIMAGEGRLREAIDEVWIYNCLQHTQDPKQIIVNAQETGRLIRIFEWLETAVNVGHPHSFTAEILDSWLGGHGKVENLQGENGCYGKCYYGIFPTR